MEKNLVLNTVLFKLEDDWDIIIKIEFYVTKLAI